MVRGRIGVVVVLGTVALAAAFLLGGPRSAVSWRALRTVVIESDDWGFAGFAPDAEAWAGVDRDILDPGRFPDAYWGSTLEDSTAVADLSRIMSRARGRDGRSAVFQPNYIMFSLSPGEKDWETRGFPDFPADYRRPGLWASVRAAMAAGTWYPELHGAWHFDPDLRRAGARANPAAVLAAGRGIVLFPGAAAARELGPQRSPDEIAADLDASLDRFAAVFGRAPASVIAPDYTWSPRNESLWADRELTVIQAKREQRDPTLPAGRTGRLLKWVRRRAEALLHPGRSYLERNCRFEPVQHADPARAGSACLSAVTAAWAAGWPATIETHRVNFVHLEGALGARGRAGLGALLAELAALEPGPLFLVDAEVAQLARRGTSVVARGSVVVVRNGTLSRRVVGVPVEVLRAAGAEAEDPLLVAVPAGGTVDLVQSESGWHDTESR